MKKLLSAFLTALMAVTVLSFAGCQSESKDPGAPPEDVIHPDVSDDENVADMSDNSDSDAESTSDSSESGEIIENAITVRIGRDSSDELSVNMIDNAAANTMMDYLSDSALLFPTYTYDEDAGFVAQNVRGSYTRDNEVTVADVKCGELYLFSGGQLRLYFKDVSEANITATPVGVFADTSVINEAVKAAHDGNVDDIWGVEVYFWITKN